MPAIEWTNELAANVLSAIADGLSLREIGRQYGFAASSIIRHVLSSREFSEQYARAKEIQAELLADEIVSIADEADKENAQAIRVRVDSRKWVASKLLAKKYGDKLAHTGPDGEGPLEILVKRIGS